MKPPGIDPLPRVGDGVLLRRLGRADLAAFQAYRHDPGLGRYQGWLPAGDDESARFLEAMSTAALFRRGEWTQIGIAAPGGGRLLGDIGLHLSTDGEHVEIGFTLDRAAQGRGLATAAVRAAIELAFAQTAAGRVVGITDQRNRASVRLLERIGMRCVESRRSLFRGEPCVELVYELPRHAVP